MAFDESFARRVKKCMVGRFAEADVEEVLMAAKLLAMSSGTLDEVTACAREFLDAVQDGWNRLREEKQR